MLAFLRLIPEIGRGDLGFDLENLIALGSSVKDSSAQRLLAGGAQSTPVRVLRGS
jgi:hypothetical protein